MNVGVYVALLGGYSPPNSACVTTSPRQLSYSVFGSADWTSERVGDGAESGGELRVQSTVQVG